MIVPRGQYQGQGPLAVFGCAWHYRQLVARLTAREIEARFRGSLLGKVWVGILPLFMLSLYTFVFGVLFKVRWPGMEGSTLQVALLYFSGIILFDFVLECLTRAPALLAEQISYVKKVLFPLEILAWVVIGGALFRVLVGSSICLSSILRSMACRRWRRWRCRCSCYPWCSSRWDLSGSSPPSASISATSGTRSSCWHLLRCS